jgi:hypothetical protein
LDRLSERVKLGLLCLLLLLALSALAFTTANTLQAARSFQRQYSATKSGDVNAIHPWMTIRVVSSICHVPEGYLYRSLGMKDSVMLRHATLYELADRKHQPVDRVVRTVKHAVLTYRKEHHHSSSPAPPGHNARHPLPTPGRAHY